MYLDPRKALRTDFGQTGCEVCRSLDQVRVGWVNRYRKLEDMALLTSL